jgi:parallel beta-helix repeat protein
MAGIELDDCTNDTVSDNIVSFTTGSPVGVVIPGYGIKLISSSNNTIRNNIVVASNGAFFLDDSDNNFVLRNVIENNGEIVEANISDDNLFSLNNIVHYNALIVQESSNNSWSKDGEGNYWDDYVGLDDGSGGRTAGDGVGDTNLPWCGVDNYPLINPVNPLLVFWDNMVFPVSIVSNSTVSAFTFSRSIDQEIAFNMIGPPNTRGYFNVSIPKELLSGPWRILLDDANVIFRAKVTENQTYTTIYVNDSRSTHIVELIGTNAIPEYPTASTVLLVTLLTLTTTILVAEKKRNKRQSQSGNCRELIHKDNLNCLRHACLFNRADRRICY